jgi:hypothetical protein
MTEREHTENPLNPEIPKLIEEALYDKNIREILFLPTSESDKVISFTSPESINLQTQAYFVLMQQWAEDPVNVVYGKDGFAFELLSLQLLRELFPDYETLPSPGALDFSNNNISRPSFDIMIGKRTPEDFFIPLILFSCKLAKYGKPKTHKILHTAVLPFNGECIFNGKQKSVVSSFGITMDYQNFLSKTKRLYEKSIREHIRGGITIL